MTKAKINSPSRCRLVEPQLLHDLDSLPFDQAQKNLSVLVARAVHRLRVKGNRIFHPPFERDFLQDITVSYIDRLAADCRTALAQRHRSVDCAFSGDSDVAMAYSDDTEFRDCELFISRMEALSEGLERLELSSIEAATDPEVTLPRLDWIGPKADLERAIETLKPRLRATLKEIYSHFRYRSRGDGEMKDLTYGNGESRRHAIAKQTNDPCISALDQIFGDQNPEEN